MRAKTGRPPVKPRIGLVVPSLCEGGGVPAVAGFIKDAVLGSGLYDLKLISLATSARDACSTSIAKPATWMRGTVTRMDEWNGLPLTHVGASLVELELQRYRPRAALRATVEGCHILQVVCGSPAFANAVCGMGIPVSVQCATRAKVERRIRDARPGDLTGWWRKLMTNVTDRVETRALARVDAIQVENRWMYEFARDLNGDRDVDLRYAPPGVDSAKFSPLPERDFCADPYVLCVGRLDDPRKNVGLLLDAFIQLPEATRMRTTLVLAGLSPPAPAFFERASALGVGHRVRFVPRPSCAELVALYRKARLFALSSDEEGLGIVVLEAMACGIPVVSTRSGGPDGIITDGEDGYLVPLDDPAAMADRMARLLTDDDLNRRLGTKARNKIERTFSSEVTGAEFIDVWDRLLHTPRSAP